MYESVLYFKDNGYGYGNATKQEYYWLKRQTTSAARAARISVHFSAVLHKTTTTNHHILGFEDNVRI